MKELLRHFWPTYPITTPMLQAKVGSPHRPRCFPQPPSITVDVKHTDVAVLPCWTATCHLHLCFLERSERSSEGRVPQALRHKEAIEKIYDSLEVRQNPFSRMVGSGGRGGLLSHPIGSGSESGEKGEEIEKFEWGAADSKKRQSCDLPPYRLLAAATDF